LVRRADLPAAIHVHTLRHSAASFLAAEGLPASDIATQLGHADGGALALRVYVHPLEENKRRAAAHLDRIISADRVKGRRMVEATTQISRTGLTAAEPLVDRFRSSAEADGNRTRLSRVAAHTGFEDRGDHQDPDASKQAF
jgi:hypothetical protein